MIACGQVTVLLSGVTHINATLCAEYSKAPWHPPNCPVSRASLVAAGVIALIWFQGTFV